MKVMSNKCSYLAILRKLLTTWKIPFGTFWTIHSATVHCFTNSLTKMLHSKCSHILKLFGRMLDWQKSLNLQQKRPEKVWKNKTMLYLKRSRKMKMNSTTKGVSLKWVLIYRYLESTYSLSKKLAEGGQSQQQTPGVHELESDPLLDRTSREIGRTHNSTKIVDIDFRPRDILSWVQIKCKVVDHKCVMDNENNAINEYIL